MIEDRTCQNTCLHSLEMTDITWRQNMTPTQTMPFMEGDGSATMFGGSKRQQCVTLPPRPYYLVLEQNLALEEASGAGRQALPDRKTPFPSLLPSLPHQAEHLFPFSGRAGGKPRQGQFHPHPSAGTVWSPATWMGRQAVSGRSPNTLPTRRRKDRQGDSLGDFYLPIPRDFGRSGEDGSEPSSHSQTVVLFLSGDRTVELDQNFPDRLEPRPARRTGLEADRWSGRRGDGDLSRPLETFPRPIPHPTQAAPTPTHPRPLPGQEPPNLYHLHLWRMVEAGATCPTTLVDTPTPICPHRLVPGYLPPPQPQGPSLGLGHPLCLLPRPSPCLPFPLPGFTLAGSPRQDDWLPAIWDCW